MHAKFLVAVAATLLTSAAAQASVIDFDDASLQGLPISSVTSTDGQISANLTVTGGIGQAVVFDTTASNTRDRDLEGPFRLDGTPVGLGTYNPGGVLIIQENANLIPDDNASGGTITFSFDQAVRLTGFDIIDGATVTVTSSDNASNFVGSVSEPANENANNRIYGVFDTTGQFDNVRNVTFTFSGSGAIDGIQVSPVPLPASLVLMAAALGGLGAMRRRRKAA